MTRQFKRFRLRQLVKDEVVEYLINGGSRDQSVALQDLEENLIEKYGDTNWIKIILKILIEVLPLLLMVFDESSLPEGE